MSEGSRTNTSLPIIGYLVSLILLFAAAACFLYWVQLNREQGALLVESAELQKEKEGLQYEVKKVQGMKKRIAELKRR